MAMALVRIFGNVGKSQGPRSGRKNGGEELEIVVVGIV